MHSCKKILSMLPLAMRMAEAFYNISTYSYNKNVLEYVQIVRDRTESNIPYIESHSNKNKNLVTVKSRLTKEEIRIFEG